MWFVHGKQHFFFFIILTFILIKSSKGETIGNTFRSSNVELRPYYIELNSTSTTTFLCINHQSDELPLVISLSKNISEDQLKIFYYEINKTTINIRLELNNYLGIFHLLCYVKDKQTQGTRADVIVKSEPGIVELINRCRVYDRQYIKCTFRAPTIARAIQNGFSDNFEFTEPTKQQAYSKRYQFFKNESTNEYLVFKFIPTIPGEFPSGITMNMKVNLAYFTPLYYRFEMTPIFVINASFNLKKLPNNQIQIQLTPISPPAICEKSITQKNNSNITQTWTRIKSTQNITIVDNLLYGTTYQICIRCRQTSNDPYGTEQCQEMRIPCYICVIVAGNIIAISVIIACLVLSIIAGVIYCVCRTKRVNERGQTLPDNHVPNDARNINHPLLYSPDNMADVAGDSESPPVGKYAPVFQNNSRSFN